MVENKADVPVLIRNASDLLGIKFDLPEAAAPELPLMVTLIGQPQQNLFGIVKELDEYTKMLNRPLYRSFRCRISYGEEHISVSLNGEPITSTADELGEMLLQFDNAAPPLLCELQFPCEALKNINLQILSSSSDYMNMEWEPILTESDYCYFTLTATSLLSMCERKALRNYLLPEMTGQLSILTTNDHLILSADRKEIDDYLEHFFKGQVPICSTEEEGFTLFGEMEKLTSDIEMLRSTRNQRAEKICLKKAVHKIGLQIRILSENSEDLENAMEILEEKKKTLPSHMKAASRRARMQYTTQMSLDTEKQASDFYHALKEQMLEDIADRRDLTELQNVLPGYITSQWENEVEKLQGYITQQAGQIQNSLSSYVENDIRSYISSGVDMNTVDYIVYLTNIYGNEQPVVQTPSFEFKEETDLLKSLVKSGETTLLTASIGLLILAHPLLGAGVALIGLKKQKNKLDADNRQGLLEACDKMSSDYFAQVSAQLDDVIKALENRLNIAVETCYKKIMETMVQALTDRKQDQNNYTEKIGQLEAVKAEMEALLQ